MVDTGAAKTPAVTKAVVPAAGLGTPFLAPADGTVLALMEVAREEVSLYGCAAIAPTAEDGVVTVTDLVEKPVPGQAPSRWILIGRYVCDPEVFEVLRRTQPGRGGEIQLTDAL